MKLEKMEQEKLMLVEEADLATKRAVDLEVLTLALDPADTQPIGGTGGGAAAPQGGKGYPHRGDWSPSYQC